MSDVLKISALSLPCYVGIATGGEVALYDISCGFELSFLKRIFKLDSLVVSFKGFQLILGIDRLGRYNISLDCGQSRVVVETHDFPQVEYQ